MEVQTRLLAATLDGSNRITARFNRRVNVHDWPAGRFSLKTGQGEEVQIIGLRPLHARHDQTTIFSIETAEPLDFVRHMYELWVKEAGSRLVSIREVLFDKKRFYDPEVKLGYTWSPEQTIFRLFAPTAADVHLVIADQRDGDDHLNLHGMTPAGKGIWEATVPGDQEGRYYAYRLQGHGFNPRHEVADIYATCMQGMHPRSLIVDLSKTDPPGFRDHHYRSPDSPADAIIYEMHVRDFTIDENSGVQNRGKYLGLAESGTHLPGSPEIATGLDHLVEMGITHVQIMPIQDFHNQEEQDDGYHWCYMPVQFNSPEGWYATSTQGPVRIREFKQAVQSFHERGIGVVMDVVYNHTAGEAPFERLVPNYYYRKTPTGQYCNGSGCGNELLTGSPMGRKFILDSLKFWVNEYRVDGFRFDLMGLIDLQTMKQIHKELKALRPDLLLYGEPWVAGPTPLRPVSDKMQIRGSGIGCFNDGFRDAIKGDPNGGPPGYVQTGDRMEYVKWGLGGAIKDWAIEPVDSVNYSECHDNLTTWDKILQSAPDAPRAEQERMARFAGLITLLAQGMPFLHAGQEFLRTKRGHHNTYNLPDVINRIDWSRKQKQLADVAYFRGLIALRKTHPVLRLRTREEVESRVWFGGVPRPECIAYILHGEEMERETADVILILLNGYHQEVTFDPGPGLWSILVDDARAGTEPLRQAEKKVVLPGHSGMVLSR